jgi:hypothetical protein
MPNPVTGDFEAVLQISGGTINRLLASMHQNAFARPPLPSIPHGAVLRIGDDRPVDGVRGTVEAQLGVPRVGLIDGATDRFQLELGVRARYRPDPDTTPLATFIHGTVHADYELAEIDPSCPGWAETARDYLWVRVVEDSVSFSGSALEDDTGLEAEGGAQAPVDAESRIARQIAALLAIRFEAAPQPVSRRFRRGSLRSLSSPVHGSAVALPLGLSGEPAGDIRSIDNLLLDGSDFAIGVGRDYIMSLVGSGLSAIAGFTATVPVHVATPWPLPDIDTVYHVQVAQPTVEWEGHGSFAVITARVAGSAHTSSVLPDATCEVDQGVTLNFAEGAFWVAPGSRRVTTHASGLGSSEVANGVTGAVNTAVASIVQRACDDATRRLTGLTGGRQELVAQLRKIDDQADARVDGALFLPDGVIARGTVSLAVRQTPVVKFESTPERDGYGAQQSWIPGGRVDAFDWSWSWTEQGHPGAANWADRFVLRRPHGPLQRWGTRSALSLPLPGLDGAGSVCLRIEGVQVDPRTGELLPVRTEMTCARFGFRLGRIGPGARGRLLLRDWSAAAMDGDARRREAGLVAVAGVHGSAPTSNTLVVFLEDGLDDGTVTALREGLAACERRDSGLLLLLLAAEGRLGDIDADRSAQVAELAAEVGAPVLLNEDVRGDWRAAFGLDSQAGDAAWGLVGPSGGVSWTHDGRVAPEDLARALDEHLFTSGASAFDRVGSGLDVGTRVPPGALDAPDLGQFARRCPPIGVGRTVVSFVQASATESHAGVYEMAREQDESGSGAVVAVVVDGATTPETDSIAAQLGERHITIPDPAGAIADRFGIEYWPTTVTIDQGTVTRVDVGANAKEAT